MADPNNFENYELQDALDMFLWNPAHTPWKTGFENNQNPGVGGESLWS